MKLYFSTPFYKNSDFMAHLVEHCVLHPRTELLQHKAISPWLDGSLHGEYTMIAFDEGCSVDDVLSLIHNPISQDVIDYEYKIFEEEFGDVRYNVRVFEKLAKIFFGQTRSGRQQQYNLSEVQQYQHKHIITGPYVLIDTDTKKIAHHTVKDPASVETLHYAQREKLLVYLEGEKNYILYSPLQSYADIVLYYFLFDVIKAVDNYQKRFVLESYYYHGPSDLYTSTHCILRVSPHAVMECEEDFFLGQKQIFIDKLRQNHYYGLDALSLLYCAQLYESATAITMIELFSYQQYIDIITSLKTLS